MSEGNPPIPTTSKKNDKFLIPNYELDNRFTYHAPQGDQLSKYEQIRAKCKELAKLLNIACPTSRELSTAFTKLDEVMFFANAAVARRTHVDLSNVNKEDGE